jgi:exosortase
MSHQLTAGAGSSRREALVGLAVLAAGLGWAYWPMFLHVTTRWSQDPQYSHGYIVPLFALALLWRRRPLLDNAEVRVSWWGLLFLGAGIALYLLSAYFFLPWLEGLALLPSLAGIAVLLGGWPVLAWAWPAIAFLIFMLPWPFSLEHALADPLQLLATRASIYPLRILGMPAFAEGNVICLNDLRLEVAAACNGLSMLVTFFALSAAITLVIDRPLPDKIVLFLSAIPVGVLMNIVRIVATAVLHRLVGSQLANAVFHDLAGWLMMPLAVTALWVELWILDHLFVAADCAASVSAGVPLAAGEVP